MNYVPPSTASQVLGGALTGLGASGNASNSGLGGIFDGIGSLWGNSGLPSNKYLSNLQNDAMNQLNYGNGVVW
jgi:hypothetical protein